MDINLYNQPLISTFQWNQSNYYYLFNILDELSHRTNPPPESPIAQDKMDGATSSIKRVIANFTTPILFNIDREPTREALINIHQLISVNALSVESNIVGGRHIHLAQTMTAREYMNEVFYTTVHPSIMKEGKDNSDLCLHFPTTSIRVNKYIYVIYL